MLLEGTPVSTFREFRTLLESNEDRPYLPGLGRRGLALLSRGESLRRGLQSYVASVIEARDYWQKGRDYWKSQSDMWREMMYRKEAAERDRPADPDSTSN
jgi:hypothetical protein